MRSTVECLRRCSTRALLGALIVVAALAASGASATAQTYGIATMQPGTLNHTTGSAIAKVLKEKAGLNVLVQPTAGETVLIPMVARGEADLGIANMLEVIDGVETGRQTDLRLIGSIYTAAHRLLRAQGQRHADDRRPQGQAGAGRLFGHAHDRHDSHAMLATAGLTLSDVQAGAGAERAARRR